MAEKLARVRVQIVDEVTKLPKENVDVITSADAVYFPDGQTFQEKWDNGDFKGDPGEDGAAATVKIGETITINPGAKAIVENVGTKHAAVLNFAIPKGEKGEDGTSIKILGRYDTEDELLVNYPDGIVEDGGFLVGPEGGPCDYYFWNKKILKWESMGSIQGPQGEIGEKGDPGEDGKGLSIKTSFPNYAKLVETYPDGSVCDGLGCVTLDTREYWYWDTIKLRWVSVGCIIGTKGDKGDSGTIRIGTVEIAPNGTEASVTNVGTSSNAVLNFIIPKGEKGEYADVDNELDPESDNPISNKAVNTALASSLNEKADVNHTHNYAGSSSEGGAATSSLECTGNSATATKSLQDNAGQQIDATYIKGLSVSGQTITYTKGDNTTATITTQDTKYTLPKATSTTLGGITVDTNTLTVNNGKISVDISKITSGMGLSVLGHYQFSEGGNSGTYNGTIPALNKGLGVMIHVNISPSSGGSTTHVEVESINTNYSITKYFGYNTNNQIYIIGLA